MNPTAKVTGYYGGYATIAPFDKSLVFAQGQVLYSYDEVLKAIANEREACAKLVEEFDLPFIAGAIRSRGEVK